MPFYPESFKSYTNSIDPFSPEVLPSLYTLIRQLLSAVNHLHLNDIVHGDIKPDNLMLSSTSPLHLILCDFGSSIDYSLPLSSPMSSFTEQFCSPSLAQSGKMTPGSDLWAVALTIYYIFTQTNPFPEANQPFAVLSRLVSGNVPEVGQIFENSKPTPLLKSHLHSIKSSEIYSMIPSPIFTLIKALMSADSIDIERVPLDITLCEFVLSQDPELHVFLPTRLPLGIPLELGTNYSFDRYLPDSQNSRFPPPGVFERLLALPIEKIQADDLEPTDNKIQLPDGTILDLDDLEE
jgi:serine/threonine protein kinase